MIVGSGVAVINGFYVEGLMVEGGAQFVEVQSATMSIAGDRESFGSTYGQDATFTLPPGDYVAQFPLGGVLQQQPFTVALGQRVEVPVLLNAGVLAVTAPGATTIEVLAAKPDLNGNRETITFEYTETVTITLPAGDYAAVAKFGETLVEGAAQVSPGARTDLPVAAP